MPCWRRWAGFFVVSDVYLETFGVGHPVVMIHGWAMHSAIWRAFCFTAGRALSSDLPGLAGTMVIAAC